MASFWASHTTFSPFTDLCSGAQMSARVPLHLPGSMQELIQCSAYLTSRNSEDSSAPFARYLKQDRLRCFTLQVAAAEYGYMANPQRSSSREDRCQHAVQGNNHVQREQHSTCLPTKTVSPGDTMVWKLGYVMGRQLLDA